MKKAERLRALLLQQEDWIPFLLQESGLPGPRGNIELAQVVADEGEPQLFELLLTFTPDCAPVNSPEEFLAFCGTLGFGRLLAQGDRSYLSRLKTLANDPRWRMHEAVAMALQRFGLADIQGLFAAMDAWSDGTWLEQRAALAAVCEPVLLSEPETVRRVTGLLERLMLHVEQADDRQNSGFQALRKALGYGWSVAIAAHPSTGMPAFERWLTHSNRDIRWIIKENLTKKRLIRAGSDWVETCLSKLDRREPE